MTSIDNSFNGDNNEDIPEPVQRVACSLCGRKFLAERLEKHQKICNKVKESDKKRKVFDSSKQRADLEQVNGFPVTPPSRQTTAKEDNQTNKKTSNWRAKHEEFLRTVRQARGEKVDEPATNGSPRVPVGYIMCQFCGRNFSDKAADRHIEWCREQKARIPRSANNNKAMERMKARTQYKPTPNKSSPKTETPPKPVGGSRSQPPTPPSNRKTSTVQNGKSSPKTESQSDRVGGTRSQPPTPPPNRKTTTVENGKPSPPKSLPIGTKNNTIKSKTSPKPVRNSRATPSPSTKSKFVDKQRINSLSRPKNSSPDSIEHLMKQAEPIMKFKEKFPNHPKSDTHFIKNDQLKELLKKTEAYFSGPRTVPGVRTGGMSPVKGENNHHAYNGHQNGYLNNGSQISEDEELEKLKSRIEELYLNGSTKYKPNSLQDNHRVNGVNHVTNGAQNKSESTTRGSTSGSSGGSSINTPPRDGSGSDGTRSRSSSTSSNNLPKFCHQCGTKYPSTVAKYCYECGSRRLGTVGPFITNLD